ncbi:MAG: hypothetical protein LBC19_09355 [Tannerella sp.]|jgi:hypothetical protein|nr:hypothetical protein [Tannerella sp.]
MKEQEDIFRRFYESFRNMEGHFHILEHRVPVEQQMAYFKYSDRIRKDIDSMKDDDYQRYIVDLRSDELSRDEKKRILSILASSKQVRAYRVLEKYLQNPDPQLINWAYMALMESRITLESELSGEKQVYISTGLGGKDGKLRFYVLILSFGGEVFLDYQREVIEKEFGYLLPKDNCEIERLTIGDKYVELVFLIPVRTDIRKILENVINECNLYGNFLSEVFTVTNVKELDKEEVGRIIERYGHDRTGR